MIQYDSNNQVLFKKLPLRIRYNMHNIRKYYVTLNRICYTRIIKNLILNYQFILEYIIIYLYPQSVNCYH